jgi:hypothetical protein
MKRQIEGTNRSEEREAFNAVVTNVLTFAILIGAIRACKSRHIIPYIVSILIHTVYTVQ